MPDIGEKVLRWAEMRNIRSSMPIDAGFIAIWFGQIGNNISQYIFVSPGISSFFNITSYLTFGMSVLGSTRLRTEQFVDKPPILMCIATIEARSFTRDGLSKCFLRL